MKTLSALAPAFIPKLGKQEENEESVAPKKLKKTREQRGPRKRHRKKKGHEDDAKSDQSSNSSAYSMTELSMFANLCAIRPSPESEAQRRRAALSPQLPYSSIRELLLASDGLEAKRSAEAGTSWLQFQQEWMQSKSIGAVITNASGSDADMGNEFLQEAIERRKWSAWATHAAEVERTRRMRVLKEIEEEQELERTVRRKWAVQVMENERSQRISAQFLSNLSSTQWFNDIMSTFNSEYELVCPYFRFGCSERCLRSNWERHVQICPFSPEQRSTSKQELELKQRMKKQEYEAVCPNSVLGCNYIGDVRKMNEHLNCHCQFRGVSMEQELAERQKTKQNVIEECEVERSRLILEPPKKENRLPFQDIMHSAARRSEGRSKELEAPVGNQISVQLSKTSSSDEIPRSSVVGTTENIIEDPEETGLHRMLQRRLDSLLVNVGREVDQFWQWQQCWQKSQSKSSIARFVDDLQQCVAELWPFSKIEIFGSFATGIIGKSGDLDLVVCFDDQHQEMLGVRGSNPLLNILADHLERKGKHLIGIQAVLLHARIPVIKATTVDVTLLGRGTETGLSIDISIDGPSHSGLATGALVTTLMKAFPPLGPISLVLKEYLRSKRLAGSSPGGLPGYGLVLMVVLVLLQHVRLRSNIEERPCLREDEFAESFVGDVSAQSNTVPHLSKSGSSPDGSLETAVIASKLLVSSSPEKVGLWSALACSPLLRNQLKFSRRRRSLGSYHYGKVDGMNRMLARGEATWTVVEGQREFGVRVAMRTLGITDENADAANYQPTILLESDPRTLGGLMEKFLVMFGNELRCGERGLSVRDGGFQFDVQGGEGCPPHPYAHDPLVIEDPVNVMNNVGRNCYKAAAIRDGFMEARQRLLTSAQTHFRDEVCSRTEQEHCMGTCAENGMQDELKLLQEIFELSM